ncbi:MAG: hypothetical protein ABJ013_14505 [Halioglobus sp.]
MRKLIAGSIGLILGLMAVTSIAQTIEVTPGDSQGWIARSSNTGVLGLGIADDQGGGASLGMSTDGTAGQIVKVARIPLITIDGINSISYRVNTNTVSGFYPVPNLEYFSADRSGTLVYLEKNKTIPANAWEPVVIDPTVDLWFSTEFGALDERTLAEWKLELPGVLMNFFQIGFGDTGSAFPVTNANVDYIELNGDVWDFEGAVTPEPPPTPETVIVDPVDQQGWFGKDGSTGTGELSTNSPRNGNGSLEFITDGSAGQIVTAARIPVAVDPISVTTVDDITAVSWEFNSSGSGINEIPVVKIEYFSLFRSGTLVYDWSGSYTPGSWEAVDGLAGGWFSTEFGSGDVRTLAEWQQDLQGVLVNFFQVGMGSTGGAFAATTAYVDTVRLATSSEDTTWNFEGDAPLPTEPALTTTTITSSAPNPSDVGESVAINFQVAVVAPDVGTPTGTVTVTDGVTRAVLCSASAAAGTCSTSFAAAGDVGLVASFVSDVTDYADSISNTSVHTVADSSTAPIPPPVGTPATPVPTMTEWALILLVLMMVSIVALRRRQLY